MKKIISAIVCFLVFFSVHAQFIPHNYEDEEFQTFLKTKKTFVLKTGREYFDQELEKAMSEFWTVSPYQLASQEEIQKYIGSKEYSFLMPFNFAVTISGQYGSVTRSNMCLSIVNGGEKGYYPTDQIVFVPIEQKYDYKNLYKDLTVDSTYLRELFRIKDIIKSMNDAVVLFKDVDKKINTSGWSFGASTSAQTCSACGKSVELMFSTIYNKRLPVLKTKTLYILRETFNSPQDIPKAYPYKYKVVDRKEYTTAISQGRKDIVYLMLTHNYYGGIAIFDPSTHEIVGGKFIDRVTTIDAGDLKDIVKALEKVEKGK